LAPDFCAAIYKNLMDEMGKTGKSRLGYPHRGSPAVGTPDPLILRTQVEGFKQGNQKQNLKAPETSPRRPPR
jgi:hypothetical protein